MRDIINEKGLKKFIILEIYKMLLLHINISCNGITKKKRLYVVCKASPFVESGGGGW